MIVLHPALMLLDILALRAKGKLGVVDYHRKLAYILRHVIKKRQYTCWDIIFVDKGDYPKAGDSRRPVVLLDTPFTGSDDKCPVCGACNFGHVSSDLYLCDDCFTLFRVKEGRICF